LSNLAAIASLVAGEYDSLFRPRKLYADIGGANGDLAFYLESQGHACHIYDYGPTNNSDLKRKFVASRGHLRYCGVAAAN